MMEEIFVSDAGNRVEEGLMGESSSTSRKLELETEKDEFQIDIKEEKKELPGTRVQGFLKQEIIQLKKRLNDQLAVRRALEKALGYRTTTIDSSLNDSFIPMPAQELIREISVLELEVRHLEHYLLLLYRSAFDRKTPMLSPSMPPRERLKGPISCQRMLFQAPKAELSPKQTPAFKSTRILPSQLSANKLVDEPCCENFAGPKFHRSHSALNHRAAYSTRLSSSEEPLATALHECQDQPFSALKDAHGGASSVISLAECLGTSIADHVPETPNKVSEDMVRCMGAIYSKLADPPFHDPASSRTSSLSSMSVSSPQYIGDMWSPSCKRESSLDTRLINPFRVAGLNNFSGPYNAMVEVSSIRRDSESLKIVEVLLSAYKSLVQKLETVDVRRMKNDEKTAFWINLHNALMMHTYLVHGLPQSSIRRTSPFIKATCTVGGHPIDAKLIQASLLGCCTQNFSGQWLPTFKHTKIKFKSRDERTSFYAIDKKEPLLRFALCSGSHSDPAVRIYTAKRLYQQLETAKEEYIGATVGVEREQKILLPKLVESYAKDLSLSTEKVVDMIQCHLHEAMRVAVQRCQRGRCRKIVEWVPHNFNFRYLLSREVANPQLI